MKIEIRVIANATKDEIIEGQPLTVKTKSPAIKGKANKTAVRMLSKYFNSKVQIVSGMKNRKKVIEVLDNP
jgi:uncharacterized protein (TIGR00251 family)